MNKFLMRSAVYLLVALNMAVSIGAVIPAGSIVKTRLPRQAKL